VCRVKGFGFLLAVQIFLLPISQGSRRQTGRVTADWFPFWFLLAPDTFLCAFGFVRPPPIFLLVWHSGVTPFPHYPEHLPGLSTGARCCPHGNSNRGPSFDWLFCSVVFFAVLFLVKVLIFPSIPSPLVCELL
jgi:hypothetical protein